MKVKQKLEQQKAAIEQRREELFKLREPIDKELESTYKQLNTIVDKLGKLLVAEMDEANIDWSKLVRLEDNLGAMALYNFFTKALSAYHASHYGIWTDTYERSIQFQFFKKEEATKQRELIKLLTPLYTADETGFVRYSIMTKDLSAGGVVTLNVKADLSVAYVSKVTYGRTAALTHANPLDITLDWLRENAYYRKRYES